MLHWKQEPLRYLEELLADRVEKILPLRKMIDMGIHISGGSDAPCTIPDPIQGIYSACNHFIPEQSLTIPEALRLFTSEGALGSFDDERDTLEKGKIADMVILNRNPLELEPVDLKKLCGRTQVTIDRCFLP